MAPQSTCFGPTFGGALAREGGGLNKDDPRVCNSQGKSIGGGEANGKTNVGPF